MKDLSAFLTPDLVLKAGDKSYVVPPPSKDVGLKLAAINAAGVAAYMASTHECPTCGRAGVTELPESTQKMLDSIGDMDLGELSLGPAYAAMVADGVPGPHIDTYAVYALYYWTLGEEAADAVIEARAEATNGPKAQPRSRSKSGRSTGSGNQTKTASTRGTGSRTS